MNRKRILSKLIPYAYWTYVLNSTRRISSTSTLSGIANGLNICIISGSTRLQGQPQPILSDRITAYIEHTIKKQPAQHHVSVIRARDNLPLLERPHFTYSKSQVPPKLERMHETLSKADAYVIISPEYNHSPCPGLMNLMNHFGSSVFSFKPSGIVSYSAGQWGGTRAAHSLRPFLSELGCLPVSAMVHVPKVSQVIHEDGTLLGSAHEQEWDSYVNRMVSQLEWWGEASKGQRAKVDPFQMSPPYRKSPSQRNAPI
jgi:Predicted flavoprotein